MPSVLLEKTWRVEGVLTNATQVLLSDPTGTFGVKRNDTGAAVVADGTAVTNPSTGVYRHTFSAAEGVAHTAYFEVQYGGATYHFEQDIPAFNAAPASATGGDTPALRAFPLRVREPWTLQDALLYVLDSFGLDNTSRHNRIARRAIIEAYRDFPYKHSWSYYEREDFVTTAAQQTTGTASYDHATRTVTLIGATFPTAAPFSRIVFTQSDGSSPDRGYPIERVLTTTTATLPSGQNPGDDVAAQSYTLYQDEYPLPYDFRQAGKLIEVNRGSWPTHLSAETAMQYNSFNHTPQSQPLYYSLVASTVRLGEKSIVFRPPPSVSRRYDFLYNAEPQQEVQFGTSFQYSTGTIERDATTASLINGTGTAWTDKMVGCVLRQSGDANVPTGRVADETENPYAQQYIVQQVASPTSLYVDRDAESFTGVGHSICGPVDVQHGSMLTAFLRLCEYRAARQLPDRSKLIGHYKAEFDRELSRAKAADYGNANMNPAPHYQYNSLKDLA